MPPVVLAASGNHVIRRRPVRILALETTERIGSVAALDDGKLLCELHLDPQQRSAQSLVPTMGRLLAQVGWKPAQVELVAACVGPGSFTGLRVGLVAAKTFAYAVGAEVLGVDTLEVVAAAAPPEVRRLCVAIDAQRGEVVAGSFVRGADGWFCLEVPTRLIDVDAWLAGLAPGEILSGPVLHKFTGRLPAQARPLDPQYWSPTAAWVGRLAAHQHVSGHRDNLWTLAPRYSRPSAAEEKKR